MGRPRQPVPVPAEMPTGPSSRTAKVGAVWNWAIGHMSFSHVQAVVGTLAGIVSVAGAVFSIVQFVRPIKTGELVAVVQEASSHRAVADAAVEVMTADRALVATMTADTAGRATHALHEGIYVVRVTHPRYAAEERQVQVRPNQTVEIRTTLRNGSSSPGERTIGGGVRAVRRALHF